MLKIFVAWLKAQAGKPVFVTIWTLFAGALGKEILTTIQTGRIDLSAKSIQSMVGAAVGTTVIALIHLYLPQPNPTVPATFPPSPQVEQVVATLKPVDPAAVPVEPKGTQ
jgi:hypothetical protein